MSHRPRSSVRAALLCCLAACGKAGPNTDGPDPHAAGSVTLDGKPRTIMKCAPHYVDGVEVSLHLDTKQVLFLPASSDVHDVYLRSSASDVGEKYHCDSYVDSIESGGTPKGSGEAFIQGRIRGTCTQGPHTIAFDLSLTCGEKKDYPPSR